MLNVFLEIYWSFDLFDTLPSHNILKLWRHGIRSDASNCNRPKGEENGMNAGTGVGKLFAGYSLMGMLNISGVVRHIRKPLSLLLILAVLWINGFVVNSGAENYQWTVFAGADTGSGSADGLIQNARFYAPTGVAVDHDGVVYVADAENSTIRKIDLDGTVSTFAGSPGNIGSTDGVGSIARFYNPQSITVDSSGNVFVADTGNCTIRKITPSGSVTTIAGSPGSIGSADGSGSTARFYYPWGITVDVSGNLYVSDTGNCTIRKITSSGSVSTIAGSVGVAGTADGAGSAAQFNYSRGLTVDGSGNLYVAEFYSYTIRKVTSTGVVSTLAGLPGIAGGSDGTGAGARFSSPSGVAVDSSGNVYVADANNHTIRKITPGGVVSTFAGSSGVLGTLDATGTAARFNAPSDVAIDRSGNLFVTEVNNCTVRKITSTGVVSTLAGSPSTPGSTDGTGTAARFNMPRNIVIDSGGNTYVADFYNHCIRKITPSGVVSTFAGRSGVGGYSNGTGTVAQFYYPNGIAIDSEGNLYVADAGNSTIRKITPESVVSTLAGYPGSTGNTDGTGVWGRFNSPMGVAVDSNGILYVADYGNHTIRKVTQAGVVTTFAGSPGLAGTADGTGSAARFNYPSGIAVDSSGDVYVADYSNHAIRKITPAGVVSTLAGSPGVSGFTDGTGSAARLHTPCSVIVDGKGTLYVAERGNRAIRKVTKGGVVSLLTDSSGNRLKFLYPSGIAVDLDGNLYVSEDQNHRITVGVQLGRPFLTTTFPGAIATHSATLNGIINPKGLPTTALFEYGLTTAYGSTASVTLASNRSLLPQTVNAVIQELLSGTTYHYRLVVTNDLGQFASEDRVFTTICPVVVTTPAGSLGNSGSLSGIGNDARFCYPAGVAVDSKGNIFVADSGNRTVRKITPDGNVTIFAGNTDMSGSADGTGTSARFYYPKGIGVDSADNLYVADQSDYMIRKITPSGDVTTLAGNSGGAGSTDGAGNQARFNQPNGIAVDSDGNVFVADSCNHTIRKITPTGVVSTLAGVAGTAGYLNGDAHTSLFNFPRGIAVDHDGNVYVADQMNFVIRKISSTGQVSTFAGNHNQTGCLDGYGASALFHAPYGLTIDSVGSLYVADADNHTIRKVTSAGQVITLAGGYLVSGAVDGFGINARFNGPSSIAVDRNGIVYVADTSNQAVRKISPANVVTLVSSFSDAGMIGNGGTFAQGSSQTVTATASTAYQFTNWTENGVVVSTEANYTFMVSGDRILVANFTMKPFYQWWAAHRPPGEVANPAVSGPAAMPHRDGTPNVLKYLCGIDPSAPLGEADKGALPVMDVADVGPKRFLTLTHRKNAAANELTVQVQVSTDLLNWVTVTPDATQTVGTDAATGDPVVQYQVDTLGATQKFIRLNVVAP